ILERVRIFREECEQVGRSYDPVMVGVTRGLQIVHNDEERQRAIQVRRQVLKNIGDLARGTGAERYHQIKDDEDSFELDDAPLLGTPEEIIARLKRLEAGGVQNVLFAAPGAGHRVVAVGHIESDIAEMEVAAGALGFGAQVWPLVADLREAGECDRVVAEARARFGSIDILVNNAGLTFTYIDADRFRRPTPQRFWEVGDEIVDDVITTNYLAADRLSRRVAPDMVARGWGRIVNVTTKLDTMNRL